MLKSQICCTEITICYSSQQMFKNPTVNRDALCNSYLKIVLFIGVDVYISLCGQQHPKCNWAVLLVYSSFFCSSSNHTTKI